MKDLIQNINKALNALSNSASNPSGDGYKQALQSLNENYASLLSYINTHDSVQRSKAGAEEFNTAGKYMAEVGFILAENMPEKKAEIEAQFHITAARSKAFRDNLKAKAKEIRKNDNKALNSFALDQLMFADGLEKAFEVTGKTEIGGKLSSSSVKDEIEKVTAVAETAVFAAKRDNTVPDYLVADISNVKNKRVGGQMSERLPVTVSLEDGRNIKGYFTEENFADFDEMFNDVVENSYKKAIDDKLFIEDEDAEEKDGEEKESKSMEFARLIKEKFTGEEFAQIMVTASGANKGSMVAKSGLFNGDEASTKAAFQYLGEKIPDIEDYISEYNNNPGLKSYLFNLAVNTTNVLGKKVTTLTGAGIQKKANINKRNNALYDVAEMLGEPDLICKSVNMTCIKDGKQINGSFMVNAKGYSYDNIPSIKQPSGAGPKLEISGKGKKSITDMQVMDYLCGNIDRHGKNMFYDVEYVPGQKGQDGKMVLNAVQGIDNDLSFGAITAEGHGERSHLTLLGDMEFIDRAQADMITALSPYKFEEKLRQSGLGDTEVEAGLKRLSLLKTKINTPPENGGFTVINTEAEWDNLSVDTLRKGKAGTREPVGIWRVMDTVQRNHQKTRPVTEEIYKDRQKFFKQEPAVVTPLMNESAALMLSSQIKIFRDLKTEFEKTNVTKASKEFRKMYDSVNYAIALMEEFSTKKELSDNELNLIADYVQDSIDAGREYILKKPKNPFTTNGKNRLHIAKNLVSTGKYSKNLFRDEQQAAFRRRMNAELKEADKLGENARACQKLVDELKAQKDAGPLQAKECINKITALSATFPQDKYLQKAVGPALESIVSEHFATEELLNESLDLDQKEAYLCAIDRAKDASKPPVSISSDEIKTMLGAKQTEAGIELPDISDTKLMQIDKEFAESYAKLEANLNRTLKSQAVNAEEWNQWIVPTAEKLLKALDQHISLDAGIVYKQQNVKDIVSILQNVTSVSEAYKDREFEAKSEEVNKNIEDVQSKLPKTEILEKFSKYGLPLDSSADEKIADRLKFNEAQEKWLKTAKESIKMNNGEIKADIDARLDPQKLFLKAKKVRDLQKSAEKELASNDTKLIDFKEKLLQAKNEVIDGNYEDLVVPEEMRNIDEQLLEKNEATIKAISTIKINSIVPDYKITEEDRKIMIDFLADRKELQDNEAIENYKAELNEKASDDLLKDLEVPFGSFDPEIRKQREYLTWEKNIQEYESKKTHADTLTDESEKKKAKEQLTEFEEKNPQFIKNLNDLKKYENEYKPLISGLNADIKALEERQKELKAPIDQAKKEYMEMAGKQLAGETQAQKYLHSISIATDENINELTEKANKKLDPERGSIAVKLENELVKKNDDTLSLIDDQLNKIAEYKNLAENKEAINSIKYQMLASDHAIDKARNSVNNLSSKEAEERISSSLEALGKRATPFINYVVNNKFANNEAQYNEFAESLKKENLKDINSEKLQNISQLAEKIIADKPKSEMLVNLANQIKTYADNSNQKLQKVNEKITAAKEKVSKLPEKFGNPSTFMEGQLKFSSKKAEKIFKDDFIEKMDSIESAVDERAEFFQTKNNEYEQLKKSMAASKGKSGISIKRPAVLETPKIETREGGKKAKQEQEKKEKEEKEIQAKQKSKKGPKRTHR